MQISAALQEIYIEASRARVIFPQFNSPHEGLAVIQEEFEELKSEVFKKRNTRSVDKMREEAKQLGAMALRFMVDLTWKTKIILENGKNLLTQITELC